MPVLTLGPEVKKITVADEGLSAENFNNMVDIANAVRRWALDGFEVVGGSPGDGMILAVATEEAGDTFPWEKLAFGYSLSGNVVTIYTGTIRQHGLAVYPMEEDAPVTLSGTTEYVYATIPRGSSTGTFVTIAHSTTPPTSNSSDLMIPLYLFTLVSPGSYTLTKILNMGDVNFDTPIM